MMKLIGLVFLIFVVVAYTDAMSMGCVDQDEEFHGVIYKCADYAHRCDMASMMASCPKTCGLC